LPSTSTSSGIIAEAGHLTHPDLIDLAQELPHVLADKWSTATNKQYAANFKSWKNWTSNYEEVEHMPGRPVYICLYLISLAQRGYSVAKLNASVAAIVWGHKLSGFDSPTNDPTVIMCLDGLKRRLSKPPHKASPILPEHINKMMLISDLTCVKQVRTMALVITAFSGFLRFAELVDLRIEDIEFASTHMVLLIRKSKTDQLRKGNKVYISRTGSDCCPVNIMEIYLKITCLDQQDNGFIFKNFQQFRGQLRLVQRDVNMSYTRVRETV
jgi:integrase